MQTMYKEDILNTPILTSERTLEIVLDAIKTIVPFELAVVLSLEEGNVLKVRWAQGPLYTPKLRDFTIRLDERPDLQKVLDIGKVQLFSDDDPDNLLEKDTYEELLELPEGHSCMVAPLHVEGKTIGLLTLDHRTCNMFTPQVVRLTEGLSRIIALALAQSMATDTLLSEREALVYERNTLLSDFPSEKDGLIGQSPAWKEVVEKIRMVAPADAPVLIEGETGTGKEQVARAIHALSGRAHRPFVALNCSALVTALAESELFGHERGAFTGAVSRRRGRFELANNGSLFLDEIGDMPIDIQPKLLRAIQEKSFERVGGEVTIHADVRIICATHKDLEGLVQEGRFREDLYYRLNVFPIHLPPLRERGDDVFLLADYFLQKLAARLGHERFYLTDAALQYLKSYSWPGNVRELQNTLERAAILCQGSTIDVEHLRFSRRNRRGRPVRSKTAAESPQGIETLDEAMRRHILKALEAAGGKIYGPNGAAALLGLKPTTLQSKMKKLGIQRQESTKE